MNELRLFHALPYPLRTVTASLRGWRLARWRYGPETEELVEAALERDRWSPEQWRTWRDERVARILERAATRVPFYRDLWRRRGRTAPTRLEDWPHLDKEAVRRDPLAFVTDDREPRRMFPEHTSGSTGTPLRLWWSRETVRAWYALVEARSRRWYGVSRDDRWAILGGRLVAPVERRTPPFWVWNAGLRQLYLSSYHLAPDLVPHYLEAIARHRVRYLWGYTSALHALARAAGGRGRDLGLKVAITNAEPVSPRQRRDIEEAFGCPVRETYGLAEIVAAAGECEHGTLHLWPEVGHVESEGDETVATGLLNADMPLIRYRLGDRLRLGAEGCPCGRTLPVLANVDGRDDDVVVTPDGRRVGRLDPIFKSDLPLHETQVIQETRARVRVLYVPADGWSEVHGEHLLARLRDHLGELDFVLEEVDAVPRIAGKLRSVVSLLPEREPREAPSNQPA